MFLYLSKAYSIRDYNIDSTSVNCGYEDFGDTCLM